MWSVNDGFGNLRKPAGNLPETCRKPTGNLPETSAEVFGGFRTIRHWRTTRYIFFHMQPCPRSLIMRIENNSDVCLIVQCIVHTSALDQRTDSLYGSSGKTRGSFHVSLSQTITKKSINKLFLISVVILWHMCIVFQLPYCVDGRNVSKRTKNIWNLSCYGFHLDLKRLKPNLFAHPNPISLIISWIIS